LVTNQLDIIECKNRFIMAIFFQALLIVVSGTKSKQISGCVFCTKRRQCCRLSENIRAFHKTIEK